MLNVAVIGSGNSSFIVGDLKWNEKNTARCQHIYYILLVHIIFYWIHMQNSCVQVLLCVCDVFVFLFFLPCLHTCSSSVFLNWDSEVYMVSISLWGGLSCLSDTMFVEVSVLVQACCGLAVGGGVAVQWWWWCCCWHVHLLLLVRQGWGLDVGAGLVPRVWAMLSGSKAGDGYSVRDHRLECEWCRNAFLASSQQQWQVSMSC